SLSYRRATKTDPDKLTLSGAAGLEFMAHGHPLALEVSLGNSATPGLVFQGGELQSLNAAVTGNFSFKGLSIAVNQLTVVYDKATDDFILDGSIGVTATGKPTTAGTPAEVGTLAATRTGDDTITANATDIDYSLLSGKSLPETVPFVIQIGQEKMEVIASSP